jgi:AcrR family transcriptional regulator
MADKTKDLILDAAFQEFSRKGKAGGRMQAIADRAGINKALLNYYFRSKEELYNAVIERGIQDLRQSVQTQLDPSLEIEDAVLIIVEHYIRFWASHQELLRLIFHDLLSGGKGMKSAIESVAAAPERRELFALIRNSGKLRERDPQQLIFHLTGLTLLFLIQAPVVSEIVFDHESGDLVEARIRSVTDLLKHGLFAAYPSTNSETL